MAPPKDIARSYPKRGLTADVGFRSEPKFCGDGSTSLDGTSDYLESTLTTALGSGFSVSLWFLKRSTTGSNNYLMSSGSAGGGSFISLSCTASVNALAVYDQSLFLTSSLTADLNQWHHAVLTVGTGANSYTVYLDGIGESLANTASPNITNGDFELGRYSLGNTHYHDGLVSDVRIYDQVLTQDQVREIYNNPGLTIPTGLSASNLRHRYKLETDYVDTGASGDDLTAFGSPSFTVNRPQLPRGLDLARGAAMARVYTGRCVEFDGSTDFLDMGTGVDKNYTTRSDQTTFSFWINPDNTSTTQWVYQNRALIGGTDRKECNHHFLYFSNTIVFDGSGASIRVPDSKAPVGQWSFVCAVADSASGVSKLYINGELFTTTSAPLTSANGNDFVIGARNNTPIQVFDGQLSNFKIFNVELTQAQVRELYHNPEMVIPTGVSASNLRRHYPLCAYNDTGGMGGRYEIDQGVEGVNGEYGGSPAMAFAQPVPCPQLGLQQSASRIHWSDNTGQKLSGTIPALGTDFTIAFWFQRGSTTSAETFLEVNTPGTYQFYYDLTQLVYYSSTAGVFYTGVSCAEGEWAHLGLTQNGVYKNGVLYTTTFSLDWLGTAYRMFGRHSASNSCSGVSSNMAFWSDALTTAEMLELYNQGPDYDPRNDTGNYASSDTLQNLWFMDDLTTVKDRKGSNDLTVIGSPIMQSFPENASGSTIVGDFSMKRKGVSVLNLGAVSNVDTEYALSAKDSAFLPSFANGGSFSCFFRLQKLGEYSTIFINDDYGSGIQHRFAVFADPVNKVRVEIGDGASARANPVTTGAISDSDWHHFAFTVDYGGGSTTTIKMFIDGVLDSTSTATTLAGVPNATALRFGDYVASGGNEANGPIACLKFYQVTLSDNEIKQIYNSDLRLIKGLANE